jgi:hypothetical protein
MATRIRWAGDTDAMVAIDSLVEPGEVDVLISRARRLRRTARVTSGFHGVRHVGTTSGRE